MLKRIGIGLLCAFGGCRSVEAAMISAFVFGPLGGLIGCIAGFVVGGRRAQ